MTLSRISSSRSIIASNENRVVDRRTLQRSQTMAELMASARATGRFCRASGRVRDESGIAEERWGEVAAGRRARRRECTGQPETGPSNTWKYYLVGQSGHAQRWLGREGK